MKRTQFAILLLTLALTAQAQTAADLNTAGFRLFTKGDFPASVEKFKEAVAKDKTYSYAWYNLACAYSKILEAPGKYIEAIKQNPCSECQYKIVLASGCIEALKKSIVLNGEYDGICRLDPDLARIRTELIFYKMLAFDFSRYNDAFTVIKNVKAWALPGQGVYDPVVSISFHEDGTIVIRSGMYDKTQYMISGFWNLIAQAGKLVIKLTLNNNPYALKSATGVFNADGTIVIDKGIWLDDWYQPGEHTYFSDYMNCCGA